MRNCERCGLASIEVKKKFCVSCRAINNVERMRITRRLHKANIVQHKEDFFTITERLKKDKLNFEKSIMIPKVPIIEKNFNKFLKSGHNKDFDIVKKNARSLIEDWEKFYYEGRVMSNEVKLAFKILGR